MPTRIVSLLVSEAVLIGACYVAACYLVLPYDPYFYLSEDSGGIAVLLAITTLVLGFYYQDLYSSVRLRSRLLLAQQVCLTLGISFLVQALLNYSQTMVYLPRWVMLVGSMLVLIAVPLWRTIFNAFLMQALGSERVLFLGANTTALELARYYQSRPEMGCVPIGFLGDPQPDHVLPGCQHLGEPRQLLEVVEKFQPNRILVGSADRQNQLLVNDLLELRLRGLAIEELGRAHVRAFARLSARELRPSELVFSRHVDPKPVGVALQTVYGWMMALVGVGLTAPLMVLVAILIKITSPGPALYRQTRVGLNDQTYTLYRFRSMRVDDGNGAGSIPARDNAPRMTGLGQWLRKLRLDELPQLFNVLRGEMSIVGPRPQSPEFVAHLETVIPFYRQRHTVKPGITGWAQINQKYGNPLEDTITSLEYDMYYIKHLTPALDLYIMWHTAKLVLLGRGER